jgi:THO complex subunit 6
VYCLTSAGTEGEPVLVSGGDDAIRVWSWASLQAAVLTGGAIPGPRGDLVPPQEEGGRGERQAVAETNGLVWDSDASVLYGATGDSCAYGWDLGSGEVVSTLRGHTDYLHCIAQRESTREVVTGSEDGTVRFWDARATTSTASITPVVGAGPRAGWVGALSISPDDVWLVLGGGACAGMVYNLTLKTPAAVLPTGAPIHALAHNPDGSVLSGGASPALLRWSHSARLQSRVCPFLGMKDTVYACGYLTLLLTPPVQSASCPLLQLETGLEAIYSARSVGAGGSGLTVACGVGRGVEAYSAIGTMVATLVPI